jgi:transcriptional regulator NrdR family protein
MAEFVVKRDGSREPFDAQKIRDSITAAAQEAGLAEERTNEVVGQVVTVAIQMAGQKEEIATSEIKARILSELDQVEPSVSAAWRKYEQEKKSA